jgi:hypothetical protein
MATFDPIQNSGAKRPEQLHIIGEKRQADWKHPESNDWQEAKDPAKRQQYPRWNPQPATGWPPQGTNCRAKAARQPIYELLKATLIGAQCARLEFHVGGTAFQQRVHVPAPLRRLHP